MWPRARGACRDVTRAARDLDDEGHGPARRGAPWRFGADGRPSLVRCIRY
jgi:hypothetical protein